MPRIGEYRGALEAQASKVIGVPVRIGSITAEGGTLFPSFELRDVVLQDPRQREALRLARVVASVSPRSLWRLNFEQLYLERPELEVRRDAAGKLHVAGLSMDTDTTGESRGADWFFAQREFVIQGGIVRWTDESRGAPPLLLSEVHFIARNGPRSHTLRLDATPPAGWGDRFSLRGAFRQPLLSVRSGNWQTWDGVAYAELPRIDIRQLGQYVTLDARIREGDGALRIWADVDEGQIAGGTADLALLRVDASLGKSLEPLVLRDVTGRLAGRMTQEAQEFSTTDLQFQTSDGMRWPGGNLWFQHLPAKGRIAERGALRADRLDLAALAMIADRLPLDDNSRRMIDGLLPRGLVERIDASWQGPLGAPDKYQARGRVSGFGVASRAAQGGTVPTAAAAAVRGPRSSAPAAAANAAPPPAAGVPGIRGATIDFDATQAGGSAAFSIANGALDFPGVFEDPVIAVEQLSAQLVWKIDGDKSQLQVSGLRFANADAEGEAQASWRTSDPASSSSGARFPGVLDLQGKLTRADGTRVYRYLPQHIPKETRDYVRDAVQKGTASIVDFRVKGDLNDMPFTDPKQGDFRIAARVGDVHYAYAPPVAGSAKNWPALTGLSGELVFERAGMQVRNARGRLAGAPGIEVIKAEAQIPDMGHHAVLLKVDAQAKGPLAELMRAGSPLAGEAAPALARARATGNADYRLRLELPLAAMDKAKVQASVALADNDIQVLPEVPTLSQARGTLNFTEAGFSLAGLQARALGGAVRIEGAGRWGATQELNLRVQGSASAEGMRAAREVDWLARMARQTTGSTPYTATLSMRDGASEFSLASSLQGLGLQLPSPLVKAPEETMPLAIEKKIVHREARAGGTPLLQDRLSIELARVGSAFYVRDISGSDARVLRGGIAIGLSPGESANPPEHGVLANIQLARVDVPAWQALFGDATGKPAQATESGDDGSAYLPTIVALRAQELAVGGRTLHNVVLGGTREGALWHANVDATELSGYAEYRSAQSGRLYARLARLKIAPSTANAVESLLDEQPGTLPALDIVVDDFELLGRRLGRAEIDAVNRGGAGREWRLNKLAFTTPEASFSAQGAWAAAPAASGTRGRGDPRRTTMDFKLDIADAGSLLGRFGMKDVVRAGRGRLEGQVHWSGSPFSLDYPSLGGQLKIDVETGQFLKAEPGIAKLLGVLSLQALPRRLSLDFRDVFSQGFSFDFLRGDARIDQGVASTNNLQMKGVNAAVLMDGSADIARETQSLRVVVVPEINAGTAALVATAINPAIGLGTFLAQMVLSRPLIAATTQQFQIDGTWADPKITKIPRKLLPEAAGTPAPPPPR
nr:YhdP family protein [Variovorax sp. PBS-H4]